MALLQNITYSPGESMTDFYNKINAVINQFNATLGGGTADQIIKKSDSADFNTAMVNSILPASGTANLKIKVIEIGDWNMDTTGSVNITHGVANFKKIRSVYAVIRDDGDTLYTPLISDSLPASSTGLRGQVAVFQSSTLRLDRLVSGVYDSASYDSTGYNRGWVTIIYEE